MATRSSAADRRRPTPGDLLVVLAVAAAAVALLLALRQESGNFLTASVVLDGETIAQYDLAALTGPVTLEVDGALYPLTIQAEPGRIRILESSCPGQDCVHTGWASQAGQQIICLPNRLVISLEGRIPGDIDAVTG
ncbi:NusG domain II-containing protein [uncultured Flavonifractor sp.]|uniref:NusG domain II-containing protein n=1 Tax=uncultured Flavonifractor sp. TaxID=1193534 RepID=UPI00262E04CB|nr:NusG domain II-containing protein [uncultured Flavonifractor sp.]